MQMESRDEMLFLYALQSKHDHVQAHDTDGNTEVQYQQAFLDAAYLGVRPNLLKIIVAVVDYHNISQDTVYLAAALLDAYRAKSIMTQSTHEQAVSVIKIHTFALAVLVTAASYINSGAVCFKFCAFDASTRSFVCNADKIPLSQYTSTWIQQSQALFPGENHTTCMTSDDLKQAQMLVASVLDWRFNRATANRFLNVFITQSFLMTSFSSSTVKVWLQELVPWTRYFCESAVMSNISCHYTQSCIATASIFAARNLLYDDCWLPHNLDDIYGIKDQEELLKCIDELLDNYQKRTTYTQSIPSQSDVVEEGDFDDTELHCSEDINSALCSPDTELGSNIIGAVGAAPAMHKHVAPLPNDDINTPPGPATPQARSFIWDSPPLWISPTTPHAERAFLRLPSLE